MAAGELLRMAGRILLRAIEWWKGRVGAAMRALNLVCVLRVHEGRVRSVESQAVDISFPSMGWGFEVARER